MTFMKRFPALLLALALLLPTVACTTPEESPNSAPESTAEPATDLTTEESFFPDVEKTDYKDASFRMVGFNPPGSWYYAESLSNEQGSLHVLNNTLYEMNTLVEEHLGIQIEYDHVSSSNPTGEIFERVQPSIMAGDDTYQLCILHPYFSYNNFITKNYALDFLSLPDFDPEQPYWNAEVMERLSINGRQFIGLGDFCEYSPLVIYCNKDRLTDAGREVPYASVRSGTWTLDEFFALTSGLYVDNGDSQRNNQDIYGFAALWDANGTAFMQACDIYVVTRDEDDVFKVSLYGERLESMYEKLYNWSRDSSTYIWSHGQRGDGNVTINFLDGNVYFTHLRLGTQFLEAKFSLGLLPMPKYDTNQEKYRHVNWGNNIVIPSTVKNKDMVGQALELLGYYSRTLVQQKYYDEVLQLRVSDAPDDRDMVELIYNSMVYDPGIAFCDGNTALWNLVYLPCFAILQNSNSIASYCKTNVRTAQKLLDKFINNAS